MSVIHLPGRRPLLPPPSIPGLHPIFGEICNPESCGRYDLRTPWREGPIVYATDGAIVAWVARKHLSGPTFALVPEFDGTRPGDMGRRMQAAGPFESAPMELPGACRVPDLDRAACFECRGGPLRTACERCGGTGLHPRSTRPVNLFAADPPFPAFGLDGWYLSLLRRHEADLHAPINNPAHPRRLGPFRFKVGPVTGFVKPFVT
jgi:hypothetical protein